MKLAIVDRYKFHSCFTTRYAWIMSPEQNLSIVYYNDADTTYVVNRIFIMVLSLLSFSQSLASVHLATTAELLATSCPVKSAAPFPYPPASLFRKVM
jgi:hypothetical protein